MVGHIDPRTVVRSSIVFPAAHPNDDGDSSKPTTALVSNAAVLCRVQCNSSVTERSRSRRMECCGARVRRGDDSMTVAVGYVFMVASWRPMRFDAFRDGPNWDSYELASNEYLNDPRPAIQELASLLVGDAREAYTLKFARYFDTQTLGDGQRSRPASAAAGGVWRRWTTALGMASGLGFGVAVLLRTGPFGFNPFFSSFYQYGTTKRPRALRNDVRLRPGL